MLNSPINSTLFPDLRFGFIQDPLDNPHMPIVKKNMYMILNALNFSSPQFSIPELFFLIDRLIAMTNISFFKKTKFHDKSIRTDTCV